MVLWNFREVRGWIIYNTETQQTLADYKEPLLEDSLAGGSWPVADKWRGVEISKAVSTHTSKNNDFKTASKHLRKLAGLSLTSLELLFVSEAK